MPYSFSRVRFLSSTSKRFTSNVRRAENPGKAPEAGALPSLPCCPPHPHPRRAPRRPQLWHPDERQCAAAAGERGVQVEGPEEEDAQPPRAAHVAAAGRGGLAFFFTILIFTNF